MQYETVCQPNTNLLDKAFIFLTHRVRRLMWQPHRNKAIRRYLVAFHQVVMVRVDMQSLFFCCLVRAHCCHVVRHLRLGVVVRNAAR